MSNNKEYDIQMEIALFCSNECGSKCNCAEYECILYRIEKIITGGK